MDEKQRFGAVFLYGGKRANVLSWMRLSLYRYGVAPAARWRGAVGEPIPRAGRLDLGKGGCQRMGPAVRWRMLGAIGEPIPWAGRLDVGKGMPAYGSSGTLEDD